MYRVAYNAIEFDKVHDERLQRCINAGEYTVARLI